MQGRRQAEEEEDRGRKKADGRVSSLCVLNVKVGVEMYAAP